GRTCSLSLHDALPIFLPDIAAVTNLYPEHVDWHGSVERYYHDKLHLIDRDGGFPVALGAPARRNALVAKAIRDPRRLLPDLNSEDRKSTRLNSSHVKI